MFPEIVSLLVDPWRRRSRREEWSRAVLLVAFESRVEVGLECPLRADLFAQFAVRVQATTGWN
ncbi:hypothetical protein [Microbacterium sp. C7(2022)]|uniref:hypothetical protein n=1 Tax=Microbacterium sp. C7(2022) TaxID=2992759 RepID=UPI00237B8A37|nr:hypothetical protein [Microbacterium sp. C7(2022)]MDE0546275.1 hypothetical protein [Microbacterium sp. C7(2022)]